MNDPDDTAAGAADFEAPFAVYMREAETAYLMAKLREAGGSQRAAAELAGMPYDTFHRKCRKHGLRVEVAAVRITRG
jgi:transcriptional regulator of acetoin/glycerol metabolism